MIVMINTVNVTLFTRFAEISFPEILSAKYFIKDEGKLVSPSFFFTSQCQSVKKQYPKPYQNPRMNQLPNVSAMVIKCNFLVLGNIHPTILKSVITIWKIVYNILRKTSMAISQVPN